MMQQRIDDLVPSAHDFTGRLEDWEQRVFLNATNFRIHRIYGRGRTERAEQQDFAHAMIMADEALKAGQRVLVYAVTDAGRYVALTQERWPLYAELWLAKKARPQ